MKTCLMGGSWGTLPRPTLEARTAILSLATILHGKFEITIANLLQRCLDHHPSLVSQWYMKHKIKKASHQLWGGRWKGERKGKQTEEKKRNVEMNSYSEYPGNTSINRLRNLFFFCLGGISSLSASLILL